MTLADDARKWHRDPRRNFAVVCYEQWTLEEVGAATAAEPDATDMQHWGLSAEEWYDAVHAAWLERHSTLLWPSHVALAALARGHPATAALRGARCYLCWVGAGCLPTPDRLL
jgi:hypothetical protein